jgi:hypothetical protein
MKELEVNYTMLVLKNIKLKVVILIINKFADTYRKIKTHLEKKYAKIQRAEI